MPELKRAYIFDVGGPHSFRTIYMDGRAHPKISSPRTTVTPSAAGKATRSWSTPSGSTRNASGSTAVGSAHLATAPHREVHPQQVRLDGLRADRRRSGRLHPPVHWKSQLRWENGTELYEYVCQEDNYAFTLMVGEGTKVDRSSLFVP